MENKEEEKEPWGRLPTSKNKTLNHLNISNIFPLDYKRLKLDMNHIILNALELERPKDEIEMLIIAGDIIDNISDQLMGIKS